MAGDKGDALAGELVGDGDGLLGIAGVVTDLERELLAEHAASGVDVGNRLLRTRLHLGAESSILAGHRTDRRNGNVGAGGARKAHDRRQCCAGEKQFSHV